MLESQGPGPYEVLLDYTHGHSAEYAEKMLHDIPTAKVVDRVKFILEQCADKVVLNIGSASGTLHEQIQSVAKRAVGVDKVDGPNTDILCDVDNVDEFDYTDLLAKASDVEVVVCGEVLEHLSNPGHFLRQLRHGLTAQVIITVPNALGSVGAKWAAKQIENVNKDHVAWYSWRTLKTLVERCGFRIEEFCWYKPGLPIFAEGLIFVLEIGDES